MQITDQKEIYNEFKYFKTFGTTIKKSEFIILSGNNGKLQWDFVDSPLSIFYILRGETEGNSLFEKWIIDHDYTILCKMTDLYEIGKTLKKNVASITINDDSFSFETVEKTYTFKNEVVDIEKPTKYQKALTDLFTVPVEYFNDDIFEIFQNGDSITTEKTPEKLIEIPMKKILSYQPEAEYKLLKGCIDGKKLIGIESKTEKIKLLQIFATV